MLLTLVQDDERKLVRIFLWKKDDPYFSGEPHTARDLENAWRYYIASYTSVDDTLAVDRTLLSPVVLLRNLHTIGADPKSEGFPLSFASAAPEHEDGAADGAVASSVEPTAPAPASAVGAKLLNRFLASKNQETLNLRVAVNNYRAVFAPNTAEAFLLPRGEREGGEKEVRDARETGVEREVGVRERFVLMNEGMKGLSREEVEGRNGRWAGLSGEVVEVDGEGNEEDNGEEGDVEMEG